MTCTEAVRLIAAAVEGGVALQPLDCLVEHIERCPACAGEAETQMLVKRLLAQTPTPRLPPGAEARIGARLDSEAASRGRGAWDWRALTIEAVWFLPVAACVVAIAIGLHHAIRRSSTGELSAAIAEWGRDEIQLLHAPRLGAGATDRQVLGVLLIDPQHGASSVKGR